MSVYKGLGGDFIMDLYGRVVHQPQKLQIQVNKMEPAHKIDLIAPDVFNVERPKEREVLQRILNDGEGNNPHAWVNSWHHQGVKYLKKKREEYAKQHIRVLATAPSGMEDHSHIIEMMMGVGPESFWVTTQWHPEVDWDENTASRQVIEMFANLVSKTNQPKEK
jgi:hypothetical protein